MPPLSFRVPPPALDPAAPAASPRLRQRASLGLLMAALTVCMARADEAEPANADPPPRRPPTSVETELAARADQALAKAWGTPAQEAANFLAHEWPRHALARLHGRPPTSTEKELEQARGVVQGFVDTLEKGPGWPRPATIRLPFAESAIAIDGRLDEPAWRNALATTASYEYGSRDPAADADTVWRLAWDERSLYAAFDCADAEIVAPTLPRDADVWNYDCIEIFLLPALEPPDYWELVVSPTGAVFDALHRKKLKGWGPERTDLERSLEGLRFAVGKRPAGGPGYVIEIAVPFDQLPGRTAAPAKPGERLSIMLARFDRTAAAFKTYSFVPLLSWGHNIWNLVPAELTR
ncbi:MAG: hypothetical protein BWZ02_01656 [Lentisphaerae bacterium ADurb.BinA184]|nr:MAG: hypothetical protein BWZ02_01656 [Lentisphaerae bacterium ADurb.BinA184]